MRDIKKVVCYLVLAALLISGAATFALSQKKNKKTRSSKTVDTKTSKSGEEKAPTPAATPEPVLAKKNNRDNGANDKPQPEPSPTQTETKSVETAVRYSYEFTQPNFITSRIIIEHGGNGKGSITFERKNAQEPITDPIEISPEAWTRIKSLWEGLNFLDSTANYQSEKQFPHLGTMRLKMKQGERERTVEFNWSNDKKASDLVNEYRRVADQAIFVFDINLAREISPLETPKLLGGLDSMLRRNSISDPKQLLPLLKDISVDERIPLIARNHASRIVKQIEK